MLSVLCLTSLTAYSASDRLDFYKKDGTFISFMTDDIKKITYIASPDAQHTLVFRFCFKTTKLRP